MFQLASASGVFELQVLEFSNPSGRLASGAACGGVAGGGVAGGGVAAPVVAEGPACRTRFALCLKEYQVSPGAVGAGGDGAGSGGACTFGRAASPPLGPTSFTLSHPLYTLALNFTFRWTVSITTLTSTYYYLYT